MNLKDYTHLELSTGKLITAEAGLLGLSEQLDVGAFGLGYDNLTDCEELQLTQAERYEIADYMISLWSKWESGPAMTNQEPEQQVQQDCQHYIGRLEGADGDPCCGNCGQMLALIPVTELAALRQDLQVYKNQAEAFRNELNRLHPETQGRIKALETGTWEAKAEAAEQEPVEDTGHAE